MKLNRILPVLYFLIAIAVSIKSFREPDLWWQIRTGEWILEHKAVPQTDVFSYTQEGKEWINVKWGFEVLAALFTQALGPESVFVIQALICCLLVIFLFRFSKQFFRHNLRKEGSLSESRFLLSGSLAFLITLAGAEYRIIGRPEMLSHLFTVLFLFILEQNRSQPSKNLYLLIPLQLLWANFHEAFGIGLVLIAIYASSSWFAKLFLRKTVTDATRLSVVLLASAAAVMINPNGAQLLLRPINLFGQVYSNKYTTELLDISTAEWWQKEAFIALGICAFSLLVLFRTSQPFKKVMEKLTNPYFISILAFLFLGLTAYRNLIFLTLVCFPAFHFSLDELLVKLNSKFKWLKRLDAPISIALLALFYVGIVSGAYYKFTGSRDRFGLEVLSVNNPVGAADYIQQHGLRDQKCFSDYLTSSYLLWKLQPQFRTYIDLRDLDVFSAEFFNDFIRDINSPVDFFKLDNMEKFHYVVLFRPQFDALHAYLYNDSLYALKYVDAVAAVYEKTDEFTRDDIFSPCRPVKAGAFATGLTKLLNPFYAPYDYSKVENDYIAGTYYLNVHRMELVKERADRLLANNDSGRGYELMGQLYYRSSMQEENDSAKTGLLSNAEEFFRKSLSHDEAYTPSLLGLGIVHLQQNNYTVALKDLDKCLSRDPQNYQAHLLIAQCYQSLLNLNASRKEEYLNQMLRHFRKANSLNPGNPQVVANIGFVYFQLNDCDRAMKYLTKVSDNEGLSQQDRLAIENCMRQCGY